MDPGEAVRAMKAAVEKLRTEMRWQAELVYKAGILVNIAVNRQLGGRQKWPEIEEVFPGLYDAEKLKEERELKKAQSWGERFKAMAEMWNQELENKQHGD